MKTRYEVSCYPLLYPSTLTSGHAHSFIHRPLPRGPIYRTPSAGTPKGRSQCRVSRNNWLINLPMTFAFRNLSGYFFFFGPLSVPGRLLSRVVRQIPYLHLGSAWTLRKKYGGVYV